MFFPHILPNFAYDVWTSLSPSIWLTFESVEVCLWSWREWFGGFGNALLKIVSIGVTRKLLAVSLLCSLMAVCKGFCTLPSIKILCISPYVTGIILLVCSHLWAMYVETLSAWLLPVLREFELVFSIDLLYMEIWRFYFFFHIRMGFASC